MTIKGEDMKPDETDLCALKVSLDRNDISMMFTVKFGEEPYIIGAPHHTPGGTDMMPTDPPRKGDENVGYLALLLAECLQGQCIIASNYWLDPNKSCNDYLLFIKKNTPPYFIEIHGHARNASEDVLISCGTETLSRKCEELARHVNEDIKSKKKNDSFWKDITVCGKFKDINPSLRAEKTLSLRCVREWKGIPYHIEISRKFRNDEKNNVPKHGEELMKIIADSLKETCEK